MIVNAVWIDSPLSLVADLCIRSWLHHGHQVRLWSYDPALVVPEGAELCDASEILAGPIHRYQDKRHAGSPVLHANLFRYEFLYARGGAFLDADTLCLKHFKLSGYAFSTEVVRNQPHPNWAFVNFPEPRSRLAAACREQALEALQDPSWGNFGPRVLKAHVDRLRLTPCCLPPELFCPIHWGYTAKFFEAEPRDALNGSYGVHLWQQVLRKNGTDLAADYPAGSLWERWKAKYLPPEKAKAA